MIVKVTIASAAAAFLVAAAPFPAQSDDIEDSLRMALEAYQAGDVKGAKEEAGFAAQLLAQMQAAGLSEFLPDPLPDWTRADVENQAQAAAIVGVAIQLMADNHIFIQISGRAPAGDKEAYFAALDIRGLEDF